MQAGKRTQLLERVGEPNCNEGCPKRVEGMEPWSDANAHFYRAYRAARALGATEAEREDPLFRHLAGLLYEAEAVIHASMGVHLG